MFFRIFFLFLRIILLSFLTYFGIGYGCVRLYETKSFYAPFSSKLVSGGVYNHTTHHKLIKDYATPFAALTLVSFVLSVVLCIFTPAGFLAAIACLIAGILVYYNGMQNDRVRIRHFVHRYRRHMDEIHLNEVLQAQYGMSTAELPTHTKKPATAEKAKPTETTETVKKAKKAKKIKGIKGIKKAKKIKKSKTTETTAESTTSTTA